MSARKRLLDGENFALKNWLRWRLRAEAYSQLAEAFVFTGIGMLVIAALSLAPVITVFMNDGNWPVAIAICLVIAGFSIIGARFAEFSNNLVAQILFSGGVQIITAAQALRKSIRAWRLSRRDVGQVAAIVLWVFKQGRKARTREICAALPDINVIRILPQLKEMPGVIWLTHHHEVIILSRVLRAELGELLGQIPRPTPEPEEEEAFKTAEEAFEPNGTQKSEVVEWYRALDLPPFSTVEKVKRRYRELVKIHHPDANPSVTSASEKRIREINAAYHNILGNSAAHSRVS